MIDKIIIRISILIVLLFLAIAILYEKPSSENHVRAAYLPDEGFIADSQIGRKLFTENCISCHGEQLQGSDNGPPLIHPYYKPDHHGDVAVYLAVYKGVVQHHWQFGDMPAQEHLTPEDAGHLVKYIRQQQRENDLY